MPTTQRPKPNTFQSFWKNTHIPRAVLDQPQWLYECVKRMCESAYTAGRKHERLTSKEQQRETEGAY